MQPDDKDLRYTAYHEAGHAVMAYIHGSPIELISLAGSFDSASTLAGQCRHLSPTLSLIDRMQITMAGPKAGKWVDDAMDIGGDDLEKSQRLLQEWLDKIGSPSGDDQFQTWIDTIDANTQRLMDTFRPWVEVVAEALLNRRVLSGEEVANIIRGLQDKLWDELHPEEKEAA